MARRPSSASRCAAVWVFRVRCRAAVFRRFGSSWNDLGRENAFGAILTGEQGRLESWNEARFLATGHADAARFVQRLTAIMPHSPRHRALDFGCGVGRVTQGLAAHFETVIGVDVAASMIRRAGALNTNPRCTFVVNRAPHLKRFPTGTFSVAYSRLVLQHVRPTFVRRYIPELVRVLAPGGVLMFQLPEVVGPDPVEEFERAPVLGGRLKRSLPRTLVVAYRRVKYHLIVGDPAPRMEMFGLARDEVVDLIARAGGRLVCDRSDSSHGVDEVRGYEYWVTR